MKPSRFRDGCFYNNLIRISEINAAAQAAMATVRRDFPNRAKMTAARQPMAAVRVFPVAVKISGMVMAVRTA